MSKLFAALAMVVLATTAAYAAPTGHGGSHHPGGFEHHGVDGHHGIDGHHEFHRGLHGPVFFGVAPFYWPEPPAYAYAPPLPSYWYYCPSAGAYYPDVSTCPDAWVPVPAS